jgi:hypothetical protein
MPFNSMGSGGATLYVFIDAFFTIVLLCLILSDGVGGFEHHQGLDF